MTNVMIVATVIPIYYLSMIFNDVLNSIREQTYKPSSIYIIDSTPYEKFHTRS